MRRTIRARLGLAGAATLALAACATPSREIVGAAPMPVAPPSAVPAVPPGMQYLYGSGEAAAISVQAWRGLVAHVAAAVQARPADSVVLAEGATMAAPNWVPCGAKPLAAVFDVDETVLLNLGAEYDTAVRPGPYDEGRWQAWERTGTRQVAPVPGAVRAIGVLRQMGVAVIFNTNRMAANAAQTEAALNGAGLGPAKHGETLYLQGDDAMKGRKDGRRALIAAKYCVVAMGGDQLGDFSDLFNAALPPGPRRAAVLAAPISARWGAGWFVLPNPVYGTGLRGGIDEVFAPEMRWPASPADLAPAKP